MKSKSKNPDRWFLVGTGKSLRKIDLDLIRDEASISCNRIHLIYDKFQWRPTAYVFEDPRGNPFRYEDCQFHLRQGYECWISSEIVNGIPFWWDYPNLRIFHRCPHTIDSRSSWHPPHFCAIGGPIHTAAQIAIFEYGATELVLLGTDGHYEKGRENHVVGDYLPKMMNRSAAEVLNRTLDVAHDLLQSECDKLGIQVWNASPESGISAHPKIALEDIL